MGCPELAEENQWGLKAEIMQAVGQPTLPYLYDADDIITDLNEEGIAGYESLQGP